MHTSSTLLVVTFCLLISCVLCDSCKNCTANYDCQEGFYCCQGQCVQWPAIGEPCPCSQCPSGLFCSAGRCIYHGLNCTCNTVSDCGPSSPGYTMDCVNNKCRSGCFGNLCQPFKAAGEQCQYDLQCPTNYVCRPPSPVLPAICTTKGRAGEYCSDAEDCDAMDCKNNACTYPARGEQCFRGACGPDDTCGSDDTCMAKNSLADGAQCYNNVQCQSSICEQYRCLPLSTFGGPCNITAQCPNGHCVDRTCQRIAFSGETCNSTHVCIGADRPCRNGVCPHYYRVLGESCASDEECAVGRCSGVCYYPRTCQVAADCGKNLACDCGECTFLRTSQFNGARYYLFYNLHAREAGQLRARSPERDCIANMVVNSACEAVIAKYYCYQTCYSITPFPNAFPIPYQIDCATLRVLSLNVTKQPCCSADAQTDCADSISNCVVFNENQIRPFITLPSAPTATHQASAPVATPQATAPTATPQSAPTSAPQSTTTPQATAPTSTPTSAPSGNAPQVQEPSAPSSAPTGVPSSVPTAAPLATPTSPSCNCAASTPLCDQELAACVGLRVVPVVQCVERTNNQYTAYMTYINEQSSHVLLSDAINFLNVNVPNKVAQFEPGRPFTYPQSAFNVIATSAQQVSWYLDGFKLAFNIAAEELECPQDVTFQMTSAAALEQLLAVSDTLVGNLSQVMQVTSARLNVTFSASTKRQTPSSVITVVVKADESSSQTSAQVVLAFVETGFATFIDRVPAAAVASVSTIPPANEQSGAVAVTTPTKAPTIVSAPSERGIISASTAASANIALLGFAVLLF